MNPPWTVIQQGKSELRWGQDPNGRIWIKRVCVFCGELSERLIGNETNGARCKVGRHRGVLTVFNHHVLSGKLQWHKRKPPQKSLLEKVEVTLTDACPQCFQKFRGRCRSICRRSLGQGKYLDAPLAKFPLDSLRDVVALCLEKFYPDKLHLLD